MSDGNEPDDLTALYAVGALGPGERKLLQARMQRDVALTEAVVAWESRLAPLSLRVPSLAPPPRVLEGVLATLARQSAKQPAASRLEPPKRQPKLTSAFVMAMAAGIAALAIALGAFLSERITAPVMIAVLTEGAANPAADEGARTAQPGSPTFVVVYDGHARTLVIRRASGLDFRGDRALVLWLMLDGTDRAVQIGPIERNHQTVLRLRDEVAGQIGHGRLVMTLENDPHIVQPRGPAIAAGRLTRQP